MSTVWVIGILQYQNCEAVVGERKVHLSTDIHPFVNLQWARYPDQDLGVKWEYTLDGDTVHRKASVDTLIHT